MAETSIRWSGVVLLVGAALLGAGIVSAALHPAADQSLAPLTSVLLLFSCLLLLLALPGMYAKQANATGGLGLAGHVLLQIGIVLLAITISGPVTYPSITTAPREGAVPLLLAITLSLGLLLTGIATIRAAIFPRGAGILLLVAPVAVVFDTAIAFTAQFLLLAIAWAWIGLSQWTHPRGYSLATSPQGARPAGEQGP